MEDIYELVQGGISNEDVEQLLWHLPDIEKRIQTISSHIQEIIMRFSKQFPILVQYENIMQQIEFNLEYYNREICYENGSWSRDEVSTKWALQVLSLGEEGNLIIKLHYSDLINRRRG